MVQPQAGKHIISVSKNEFSGILVIRHTSHLDQALTPDACTKNITKPGSFTESMVQANEEHLVIIPLYIIIL